MTGHIDRDELRRSAEGWLRYGGGVDYLANGTLALLDALDQAEKERDDIEDRAERAVAVMRKERDEAREKLRAAIRFEADARQEAKDERGAALDALEQIKLRDERIADVLALCDEWAAMGTRQMNIGAVRRALEGVALHEATALGRAEARIKDALGYCGLVEEHPDLAAHPGFVAIADIRRALDGNTTKWK